MSETIKKDVLVINIKVIQYLITYLVLQKVFLVVSEISAKKKSERTFETPFITT